MNTFLCDVCNPEKTNVKTWTCVDCKQVKAIEEFNTDHMLCCCRGCGKDLPQLEFQEDGSPRLSEYCKICTKHGEQRLRHCHGCQQDLHLHRFNDKGDYYCMGCMKPKTDRKALSTTGLPQLRHCAGCEQNLPVMQFQTDKRNRYTKQCNACMEKWICCNECKLAKAPTEFDVDKSRVKYKRCRECQHPPCDDCGEKLKDIWTPHPLAKKRRVTCPACKKKASKKARLG